VTTYTLDIEDNYDFDLMGISSHERDYRLAWSLNRCMDWKLTRIDNIIIDHKTGTTEHAQFRFTDITEQSVITLIDNKTPNGLFLPEAQQFDYLLKIDNDRNGCDDLFFKKIRSAQFVITAYPLEVSKLKSKQNLLYEYR
jgi:hypothetical protein